MDGKIFNQTMDWKSQIHFLIKKFSSKACTDRASPDEKKNSFEACIGKI